MTNGGLGIIFYETTPPPPKKKDNRWTIYSIFMLTESWKCKLAWLDEYACESMRNMKGCTAAAQ